MKTISGWPGTSGFLGRNDAKIWKGGDSCNCWIHLWMRSSHSGAAAVFGGDYGRCSFASTRLSVSQWSTWWATKFSSAIFQFYFPWTSILVKQGDQRKSLITRDRASEYSELWRITWAGLTPARMKVKVKAKQSCKGWIPKSTIPRITLTTVTVICIALDT